MEAGVSRTGTPQLQRLAAIVNRELARRGKTPRKLTLLARATAAGRVTPFEAFGSISSMAGADAFGVCKGIA